jgi:hypothetical protein
MIEQSDSKGQSRFADAKVSKGRRQTMTRDFTSVDYALLCEVGQFLSLVNAIGTGKKNRFGKPEIDTAITEPLRQLAIKYVTDPRAEDTLEQMGKVSLALLERLKDGY